MKHILLFAVISAAVVINSGCSSKLMSFEKRKYNKGYHVDFVRKQSRNTNVEKNEQADTTPLFSNDNVFVSSVHAAPDIAHENNFADGFQSVEKSETKQQPTFVYNEVKKSSFNSSLLKPIAKQPLKKAAGSGLYNMFSHKNTAGITRMNPVTILGAIIGGGSLIALTIMLFSTWASVLLLILLVSGCFLGFITLIIGANI